MLPQSSLRFRSIFATLIFFLLAMLFLPFTVSPAESALLDDFNTFPVTRYKQPRPDRTGNNNYYAMTSASDASGALIAASGREDLLVYSEPTFRTRRRKKLIYYQSIESIRGTQSALLVGSQTPPDTGGAVVRYRGDDQQFVLESKPNTNLMGVALRTDTRGLVVGGTLVPDHRGVVYEYKSGELARLETTTNTVLHDVDWHPDKQEALIVGERGIVLSWSPDQREFTRHDLPHRKLLQTVDWDSDRERALIGGSEGTLYLYKSGEFTRITTDFDWNIKDVKWNPETNQALLVGGRGQEENGYWGIYEGYRTTSRQLSQPLFSATWLDAANALVGGQKVLWRISRNRSPSDFGLNASLSVSNTKPRVSEPVVLSGFGSTYEANADSVTEFRFHNGTGDSTGWQNDPNHRLEYLGPGTFTVRLDVRSPHASGVRSQRRTIQVVEASAGSTPRGIDFYYWLTFAIFLGSLLVAYTALRA